MALKGIKVVELAGLAPVPMCGMILRDFGARVIRVSGSNKGHQVDAFSRGKESIQLNLKRPDHVDVMRRLCSSSDVLLDPYRPGVLEKLSIGPESLLANNPRLIVARLTGYGQPIDSSTTSTMKAGHDINYLATSGVLSSLGKHGKPHEFPVNLLGDFGGGSLICALGILMALYHRGITGRGQIVDSSITEGTAYLSTFLWYSRTSFAYIWGQPRGGNILDGGVHFYRCYLTKDGGQMAVGALEPQFYAQLLLGLGLSEEEAPQFGGDSAELGLKFAKIFASKTRTDWTAIFAELDACVTPVLGLDEAASSQLAHEKASFLSDGSPAPSPRLSEAPFDGQVQSASCHDEHMEMVLTELGYSAREIAKLTGAQAAL